MFGDFIDLMMQENVNASIWNGIEQIDTQVLIHLLIEWLRSLEVTMMNYNSMDKEICDTI